MKKLFMVLIVLLLSLAGCSNEGSIDNNEKNPNGVTNTDGTFTGEGNGYGGKVQVEVVIENGELASYEVIEHSETSPVIKRALPVIEERILEEKSPIVDSVSGATFSSFAIKTAVADAMRKANIEVEDITMATVKANKTVEVEDLTTQFLSVGSGPAGLGAAIAAKESGVDDILIIEKLDILSGNGKFDMMFFNYANTQAQRDLGIEDSADQFFADLMKAPHFETEEKLRARADGVASMDDWFRGMDIELNYIDSGRNHFAESDAYAGEEVQDGLENKIKELGINVLTGIKGGVITNEFTQVLNEDNQVVENLFAAGEVTATAGVYLDAIVFGKLCGEQVAKELTGE